MFARISSFKGTTSQIEAITALIRDRIEPSLRTQTGFLGIATVVDRATGEGHSATYWSTGAEMGAAEEMGVAARSEAAECTGLQLTDVDRFEVLLQDRVAQSEVGTVGRTTELRGAPDKVDATVAFMKDKGIGLLRARKGYRAMMVMANRASGRIRITSSWNSAVERDNTQQVPSNIREEVARVAGSPGARVICFEVVQASVSTAAQQAATAATC
ncbi:MAG TPA: hypothetical protein VKQ30_14240 [Ktedonobacterales bacterium]|nr:hypothetical protein [Ktedonobacterales bacterium]